MPFIAKLISTGERVDITRIENPRQSLRAADIVCQLCGEPMIVKAGLIVRPHFAHKTQCTSDYAAHPESLEHLATKRYLADALRAGAPEYFDVPIDFEVPVPEVRRVADLMITFPTGHRIAHEVQLASITTEELQARTNDYLHAGIDVVWWLGGSADTPANREWTTLNLGAAFYLNLGWVREAITNETGKLSEHHGTVATRVA